LTHSVLLWHIQWWQLVDTLAVPCTSYSLSCRRLHHARCLRSLALCQTPTRATGTGYDVITPCLLAVPAWVVLETFTNYAV